MIRLSKQCSEILILQLADDDKAAPASRPDLVSSEQVAFSVCAPYFYLSGHKTMSENREQNSVKIDIEQAIANVDQQKHSKH